MKSWTSSISQRCEMLRVQFFIQQRAEHGRYAVQQLEPVVIDPFHETRRVREYVSAVRRADGSTAAQRHEHVFEKAVETGRRELADARAGPGAESFDFPTHEVIDPVPAAKNRFRPAG